MSLLRKILIGALCYHATYATPQLNTKDDFKAVELRLQQEPIAKIASLGKGTHAIQLITLENGMKGIFKTGEYQYAEVAGYRLSKLLGLNLVPPTVFRDIKGTQGSLQLYIDAPDLYGVSNSHKLLEKVSKKAISDMKLFYYVAGQWDTHHGNQLLERNDDSYRLWLIDNSGMLHRVYSKYRGVTFIEKGENKVHPTKEGYYLDLSGKFPFDKAITIPGDYKNVRKIFSPFITSKEHIKSLSEDEWLTYAIWNNTLWLAYNTEGPTQISRHTTQYYSSTLKALKGLTEKGLEHVWAEWLPVEPAACKEIIQLILMRRDEVLAASDTGTQLEG